MAGDTLIFAGPARFQYALDADGRIAVDPDGSLAVAWWLRDERACWVPWTENRFTRVVRPA